MNGKGHFWWFLFFLVLSLSGCYYFGARDQTNAAEGLLAPLKAQGGDMKGSLRVRQRRGFFGGCKKGI